ncbi:MAG: HD domain-containing protein [Treponema sp.]|jgi:poly(A) polymerase|nr:HD domain-containing protein [Treponema sp.]
MNFPAVQSCSAIHKTRSKKHTAVDILAANSFPVRLCSFSALDSFLNLPSLPYIMAETEAGIADLARVFENLRFPGADIADAAAEDADGQTWYFYCRDPEEINRNRPYVSYDMLSLTQEFQSRRFWDAKGIYEQIRKLRKKEQADFPWWEGLHSENMARSITDGAIILARYEAVAVPPSEFTGGFIPVLNPEAQRILLSSLMVSPRPDRGLEFLRAAGLLEKLWPELAALDNVDQAKEFHPEGNVWRHTLETLRHRKEGSYDLRLSLSLLLHDIGKPLAESSGGRRFDGHAELGAAASRRFLERLGFEPPFVDDVYFLVRNHMLPAALGRLPLMKTGSLMASPLFPLLMELYRCDESSSFKGLDAYYESAAVYRTYLRNTRNPYRSVDGKVPGRKARR